MALAKEGLSLNQWERDCSHHEGAVMDEDSGRLKKMVKRMYFKLL